MKASSCQRSLSGGAALQQLNLCLILLGMLGAKKAGPAESDGQMPTELHSDHLADPH